MLDIARDKKIQKNPTKKQKERKTTNEKKSSNNSKYVFAFTFLYRIRKATDVKSLRINCWEINQVTSKCQIDILNKTCKKKGLKQKKEHHRLILHIQNGLGTKFQLKLTILNFWTTLT